MFSLLHKKIVPVNELNEMVSSNSPLLDLFKDIYDVSDKLFFFEDQDRRFGANAHFLATRRLLRDLKELHMNPLPTVAASPLSDNMLLWHANLQGTKGTPFEGLTFHLVRTILLQLTPVKYLSNTTAVRSYISTKITRLNLPASKC